MLLVGVAAGCLLMGASINCNAGDIDTKVIGWWTFLDAQNPGKDSSEKGHQLSICGKKNITNGEITLKGGTIKLPKEEQEYLFCIPKIAEKFKFGNDSFSVECWFKSSKIGYTKLVGSRSTIRPLYKKQTGWALGLSKNEGSVIFILNDKDKKMVVAETEINEENWDGKKLNYLVGVRDKAKKELRLYVNGKLVSTTPDTSGDIAGKHARLGLGYDKHTGHFTKGTFAEIKITKDVLSTADVAKKYKTGPSK